MVQQGRDKIKLYNDVIACDIGSVIAKGWSKSEKKVVFLWEFFTVWDTEIGKPRSMHCSVHRKFICHLLFVIYLLFISDLWCCKDGQCSWLYLFIWRGLRHSGGRAWCEVIWWTETASCYSEGATYESNSTFARWGKEFSRTQALSFRW